MSPVYREGMTGEVTRESGFRASGWSVLVCRESLVLVRGSGSVFRASSTDGVPDPVHNGRTGWTMDQERTRTIKAQGPWTCGYVDLKNALVAAAGVEAVEDWR